MNKNMIDSNMNKRVVVSGASSILGDQGIKEDESLIPERIPKVQRTVTINKDIDRFYNALLKELENVNRSDLFNNVLRHAIFNHSEFIEMTKNNENLKQIVEDIKNK